MEKVKITDGLTYTIIGCAMKVYGTLGNGFPDAIYPRALAIELRKARLNFALAPEVPVFYDGEEIGMRRVDFLVEEQILIETKAISALEETHLTQGLHCLAAYQLEKGLLINFGGRSLEVKRLRLPRSRPH